MGSPLGPVLANIFVGPHEQKIPQLASLHKRYMDDSLSMNTTEEHSQEFLKILNSLHPALQYTCENESAGKFPFLDILIRKKQPIHELVEFTTSIYRKPTYTGQYTRWDSFSSRSQKVNLIKCLTTRALRICSTQHLQEELEQVRTIFLRNSFPAGIIERVIKRTVIPLPCSLGPKPCPVYVRLPWIGTRPSERFEQRSKTK